MASDAPKHSHDARDPAPQHSSDFHWNSKDTAFLQPSVLHIPRVQRAWERKPASPFSRQRVRVGKVWKRTVNSASAGNASNATASTDFRDSKRSKLRPSGRSPPLQRAVKKMCFDSGFGLGASVRQWEACESPVRKIVTRSNARTEDMVALPDDDDEVHAPDDQEGDVTIEIFNEDGTVEEVDAAHLSNAGWEDEQILDLDISQDNGEGRAELQGADDDLAASTAAIASASGLLDPRDETPAIVQRSRPEPPMTMADDNLTGAAVQNPRPSRVVSQQETYLPDGFVSPVKRRRFDISRIAGRLSGARRKTLPVQFAPASNPHTLQPALEEEGLPESPDQSIDAYHDTVLETQFPDITVADAKNDPALPDGEDIGQWVDVESEDSGAGEEASGSATALPTSSEHAASVAETAEDIEDGNDANDALGTPVPAPAQGPRQSPTTSKDTNFEVIATFTDKLKDQIAELQHANGAPMRSIMLSPTKLPSSPVPTIEGQHPRLPLRRSPRRKSSSPLKQSIGISYKGSSHLVALTPVKMPIFITSPSELHLHDDVADSHVDDSSPLERASSAPPEEVEMSPRRASRPRLSDDTELLQAFLSRAAASRRQSTSARELVSNRRESDTVRQALASPAKVDVLGELDPNSPSPRKASPAARPDDNVTGGETSLLPTEADEADEELLTTRIRRSGRAGRKVYLPAQGTPAAPNKISIRGNTEQIVLKRTEAQELAQLTRANTRSNKGAALMPLLRLNALALGLQQEEAPKEDSTLESVAGGKRNIVWSKTLVEFYQTGEILEADILDNAPTALVETVSDDGTASALAAAPSAALTPSRRTPRRVKTIDTVVVTTHGLGEEQAQSQPASTDDKIGFEHAAAAAPHPSAARPPTKRRSRIATPAKGLGASSLLPADVTASFTSTDHDASTRAKKKKPQVSKLPAPSMASVGQNKENMIASPAKKGLLVATAAGFAPKLDFHVPKMRLEPSPALLPASADVPNLPGLMSPPKKASKRNMFTGNVSTAEDGGASRNEETPGLASPAKKRTRRVGM